MIYKCFALNKRKIFKSKKNETEYDALVRSLAGQFGQSRIEFESLSKRCKQWYMHYYWPEEIEQEFVKIFTKKNAYGFKGFEQTVWTWILDIGPTCIEANICKCEEK